VSERDGRPARASSTPQTREPRAASVGVVLLALARHPVDRLLRRWNWKSAVLSSAIRSTLFFTTNLAAGLGAAQSAFVTELAFRGATAGFYGALTQAFREAHPEWAGTVGAMIVLPVVAHTVEALVHWLRGTARLVDSMAASIGFSVLSTAFNLFAMRRGILIVGDEGGSLRHDLAQMPGLWRDFMRAAVKTLLRRRPG